MKTFNLDICLKRSKLFFKKRTSKSQVFKIKLFNPATKNLQALTLSGFPIENLSKQIISTNPYSEGISFPVKIFASKNSSFKIRNLSFYFLFQVLIRKGLINKLKKIKAEIYHKIFLIFFYKVLLIKNLPVIKAKKIFSMFVSTMNSYDLFCLAEKNMKTHFKHKKKGK